MKLRIPATKTQFGFSLIELMIVVAIVGILAAVAYPAYTSSIQKGRRAQARTAILELLQQQERYMTQRNTYVAFSNTNGTTTPASVPFKTYSGDSPDTGYYWLSAGVCSNTLAITECVEVVATPKISDPLVGNLSMQSTGQRSCSGSVSSSNFKLCWP